MKKRFLFFLLLSFIFVSIIYVLAADVAFSTNPYVNSTDGTNLTTEKLWCSFVPTGDATLEVNFTWLKGNVTNLTFTQQSVTTGVLASFFLDSVNTTVGDLWSCEVQVYNSTNVSAWVNSSQLEILNTQPVFQDVTDFNKDEDFTEFTLDLSDNISDDDDADSVLEISYELNDTTIFSLAIVNSTNNATFTATANQSGSVNVSLTLVDSGGLHTNTSFVLNVDAVNDAPMVPVLNQPLNNTNMTFFTELNISNSTDVEGDTIYYYVEVDDNIDFSSPEYVNASITETTNTTGDTPSGISDGIYNWRVLATDNTGNSSWSEIRQFIVDTAGPTITLNNPINNTWNSNDSTVVFGFTAYENLLLIDTCELYGDFNGSWSLNQTDTTITNNSQINFTSLILGDNSTGYTWNVQCNDSFGNSAWNSSNYTSKVDNTNPTATITAPSDTSISVLGSIKYTCSGTDSGSGVSTCTMTITKPDSTTYTKTGCTEQTLQNTDTGQAGTYTVDCSVVDVLSNTATATSTTFLALYSSTGGGGGGGGSSTTVSFDVDFSGTVSEATLKAQQGVKKTFSFDGATKHTITFKEVTTNRVVLEIASDPVTVELGIGETVDVDVNGDGVMDMSVTLNSIENDNADITVMKYEEGAQIVKEEEEVARGVEEEAEEEPVIETPTVTEPEAKSKAMVWILLLVIAVVGVVAYFVMRKK